MEASSLFKEYGLDDNIINNIEASVKNLYNFYKRFVASNYNPKCEAPHIEELSKVLEDMYRGDVRRLCVAMPPRHSKSSLITLAYPFWLILHNPSLKILVVNAEAGLSETFGVRLRELFRLYGGWFGVYLSDVKYANRYLMFEDANGRLFDGSIRLVGSTGSITGHDADYLILDDIYKGADDIKPTQLNKKIEWFKTMILQRLEPKSKLIILHTRWHSDDLQGYLKTHHPKDYKFIEYPAIKEDNTPLWSERYNLDYLNELKEEMGERLFKCIFQQTPMDNIGGYFDVSKINFVNDAFNHKKDNHKLTVRSWDLAYSDDSAGDKNDYSAGVLMSKISDKRYIISDIQHKQYGDHLKHGLLNVAKKDTKGINSKSVKILIETGTIGGASKHLFNAYTEFLKDNGRFWISQSKPIGSKVDRAYKLQQAILDGEIYVSLKDEDIKRLFIQQLKAFPYGKHDDIVDAMAYAYNFLSRRRPRVQV